MRIALAADHGGFDYKEMIKEHLLRAGHEVTDFGTYSPDSCDYPDFVCPAARSVSDGRCDRAVLICRTGNGSVIVANKVSGVRAALCMNEDLARLARAHNDANAVAIGADFVDRDAARQIVDVFLATDFDGGRHKQRVDKIDSC